MNIAQMVPVDTSACEREQVHVPGAIQPFGCLVAFALPTWTITHASENLPALLDKISVVDLIGAQIEAIFSPKVIHDLRNTFQASMISGLAERLPAVMLGVSREEYDIYVHAAGRSAVAELIPVKGADTLQTDPTGLVKTVVDRLRRAATMQTFLSSATRQLRAITGFDRVMVYKFLEDDSGQVVAEAVRSGLPPFLHLHYPASDIPPQSRALFKRQWLRAIPDVRYRPVAICPAASETVPALDLSLSILRSVSPIHIQYLKNMGSAATLTVSILEGERLWGLIACHHETPRRISASTSAAVELLAQVFSSQIETKQQRDEAAQASKAREAHDLLIETMQPEETIFQNLTRFDALLKTMIPCDGIGIWTEGRFEGSGILPPDDAIDELIRFLGTRAPDKVFAIEELARELPDGLRYADKVSGVMAIPFSRAPTDFLILFRREVRQTVRWGGDPNKAFRQDTPHQAIGPRASFAAWKQTVHGKSLPWRPSEKGIAETLRVSLLDLMLRRAGIIDRERRAAQESQLLLVAELNHRVKNVLAVIRSLVRQSAQGATSLDVFTSDLQRRIHALSVAHDQLTQSHWKAAPLQTLIEAESRAWIQSHDRRLVLSGPPVMIEARAYQTLALVLHELMTNAAKYGALSVTEGSLRVAWRLEATGDLTIKWVETGGPAVSAPKKRGFGSIVVEQSIPFELKGSAAIRYEPYGVSADFTIPRDFVQAGLAPPAKRDGELAPRADLRGKNLLLVEDSMIIALDAQTMLQGCGAEVELAATASDARRAIKLNNFDAAILDVNLYTETSFAIAEELQGREIPFVFATGYGETVCVPERFKDILVVSKPYAEDALRAALAA